MSVQDELRAFWDRGAGGYDADEAKEAKTAGERAAWNAALVRHLPAAPIRVLDIGAGTGFLSLLLARLGHEVTALDLSSGMLARLEEKATRERLSIQTVSASADEPPKGHFDAIVERHVLWTLPDPRAALAAWRAVAPQGRLLLFEVHVPRVGHRRERLSGRIDRMESVRSLARNALRHRRAGRGHLDGYDPSLSTQLPLLLRMTPEHVVSAVEETGWGPASIERLWDVEWARALSWTPLERLVGVEPTFLVAARA